MGQGNEVPHAQWAEGAIGRTRCVGISLKKVIKDCGGLINGAKHLEFYGAETSFKANEVTNYTVSVPWSKANLAYLWVKKNKTKVMLHSGKSKWISNFFSPCKDLHGW